jgi:hypothetical protein
LAAKALHPAAKPGLSGPNSSRTGDVCRAAMRGSAAIASGSIPCSRIPTGIPGMRAASVGRQRPRNSALLYETISTSASIGTAGQ